MGSHGGRRLGGGEDQEEPEEHCQIIPQKTCRTVRRLHPELVPQSRCTVNPKKICHLKFLPNPELPEVQPLIKRFCLREKIELNVIDDEKLEKKMSTEFQEPIEKFDPTSARGRKLEISEFSHPNLLAPVWGDKKECSRDKTCGGETSTTKLVTESPETNVEEIYGLTTILTPASDLLPSGSDEAQTSTEEYQDFTFATETEKYEEEITEKATTTEMMMITTTVETMMYPVEDKETTHSGDYDISRGRT